MSISFSSHPFPPVGSFALVRSGGSDPCNEIIRLFNELGVLVTRDIVIGMVDTRSDLVAQPGDFWFHTDGVFLENPPRWVIIQLLEAESGGELYTLNTDGLIGLMPQGNVLFGKPDNGIIAPIISSGQVFRYRKDYMHQLSGGAEIETVHELVRRHSHKDAVLIDPLLPQDCLIIDNWRVMHRRSAFQGRRVIRRVWLT